MKTKLKMLFLLLLTASVQQNLYAQANERESFSINFGPEIFIPESDFRNTHRPGFGANIKAEYTFGKHASATVNTGLASFAGKSFFNANTAQQQNYKSLLALPVKAGGRYYLGSFYFLAETGIVFIKAEASSNNMLLAAGLGDKIKAGYNKLDISLRQERWFNNPQNLDMAVLRVAYEIGGRKKQPVQKRL